MEDIKRPIKSQCEVILFCMIKAIRHPLTPISSCYGNPVKGSVSPVPWWGSGVILVLGITSWVISAHWKVEGLDEAARAMVYIPLGNIFGMSISLSQRGNDRVERT